MKPLTRLGMLLVAIALSTLLLSACAERLAPAPAFPTTTRPAAVATNLAPANLARGQQVYLDKQCVACHGATATGGVGKALAGTTLTFDRFLYILRNAIPPKPSFNEVELPAQDAYDVYGWLRSLTRTGSATPAPPPDLGPGKVLGMTLWVQGHCDTCHGAFAQGSPKGPTLAGVSGAFEQERDRMRQNAGAIPGHADQVMDDATFQRLYQWLKQGANPNSGC
ncbi:MAG: c-type cytochrome [Chloroflexi bacterium]|nr:c-type cytochrome [Chloroflexota bacterium]